MLKVIDFGHPGAHPPLVIAHGLFGSARNWSAIGRKLSDRGLVRIADLRNHGASPWHDTNTYADMAGDLAELIEVGLDSPVDLLGHSMGGKAAMVLALLRPDLLRRLIVADIAPAAYAHSHAGLIAAMRRMDLTDLTTRGDADRRLAETVKDATTRAFLLQSLDLRADPPRWQLNLDTLDRAMPDITGWPEVTGSFDKPVLFLSGGASDYLLPEHRPAIKVLFPKARFAGIPGVGHWLHAERPDAFAAAVRGFLD